MLINRIRRQSATPLAVLLPLLIGLQACSRSGDNITPTDEGAGSADVLVHDAPLPGLLAFQATINSLTLERTNGGSSANLLASPMPVEFVGLQDRYSWLARVEEAPLGTFEAVRMEFASGSYSARGQDGTSIGVTVLSDTLIAPFVTSLTIDGSSYVRIEVDLSLADSLSGSVAIPPIIFDPQGMTQVDEVGTPQLIDEFQGIVRAYDEAVGQITVEAFLDDAFMTSLGMVDVEVLEVLPIFTLCLHLN